MSFSSYLVGSFEKRLGVLTQFQIINPTTQLLEIHAIFLNDSGVVEGCVRVELGPNALWETDTGKLADKLKTDYGVAKFFSLRDGEIKPGIVGVQRRLAAGPGHPVDYAAFAESNLAAVPEDISRDDYNYIGPMCP